MPFIWGYKVARISKTHVYKPKCLGGLGLPNFRHYYWAANCRTLMYWRDSFPGIVHVDTPSWLAIEQNAIHSSLSALLFSAPLSSKEVPKTNLILKNSIKIWYQIRKVIKLPNTSLFSPICYNHVFKPSLSDNDFREWQSKGILIMKDLYINNTFPSFSQFSERFDLPSFHFFRYLQVRNFVRTNFTHFEILPLECKIFDLFSNSPDAKGIISLFVNVFKDNTNFSSLHLKIAWEEDLGIQVSETVWDKCLSSIYSCSINSRHQLIQYKVLHRLHYSKTKLSKFYSSVSPICDKCKAAEGTLAHLFWFCAQIQSFWIEIFHFFAKVYNCALLPDPFIAILGWSDSLQALRPKVRLPIQYGVIVAKKVILLLWKKNTRPLFSDWLTELTSTLHLERIRYSLSGNPAKFDKMWEPVFTFLSKQKD